MKNKNLKRLRHVVGMYSLKGPPLGEDWKPRSCVIMRRQMTGVEATRANEMYELLGWREHWVLETGSDEPLRFTVRRSLS